MSKSTAVCWCDAPAEYMNEATDASPAGPVCAAHVKDGYSPLPGAAQPAAPATPNPWLEQHVAAELEHAGGEYTRRAARSIVRGEYAMGPGPIPCECGGTAHYRATVGVRKCADCGAMYRGNGARV